MLEAGHGTRAVSAMNPLRYGAVDDKWDEADDSPEDVEFSGFSSLELKVFLSPRRLCHLKILSWAGKRVMRREELLWGDEGVELLLNKGVDSLSGSPPHTRQV